MLLYKYRYMILSKKMQIQGVNMKNFFIINKNAGKGNAFYIVKKQLDELDDALKQQHELNCIVTTKPLEGVQIVRDLCQKYQNEEINIFACGGDGTAFEIANGLVESPNVHMGIIPVGSCNDFLKSFPEYEFISIKKQLLGTSRLVDILKVDDEYSLNVANFGYDAKSNYDQIRYRKKFKTVKAAYNFALFKNIISPRLGDDIIVKVDNEVVYDGKALLLSVANAKYYGGGYKCSPLAIVDDGILDVVVVKKVFPLTFLRLVKYYKRGEHLENPRFEKMVTYKTGKKVEIIAKKKDLFGCLDGETRIKPHFNVEIVPKSISFILPKK